MATLRAQRLVRIIALLALASAHGPAAARAESEALPPVAHAVEGPHFRILCHFDAEPVARQALMSAEAAWRPTVEVLGREPQLDAPIDIHLLRTPEVYRAVEKRITNGRFERNNAFSSWASRVAYVALEPVYADALLARIGLTSQTRRTIAHEAAHLIVYHTWSSYRRHPAWLAEGIAIWAADAALVRGERLVDLAARPASSKRMLRYRALAEEARLPDLRDVFGWDRYRDLDFNERYAFWWGLFRYLYTGPRAEAFRSVLAQIGDMPAGAAFAGALRTAMTQAFTDEDGGFEKLQAELAAFGRTLEGRWDEPIRMLDVRGDTWWQLAFPGSNALCWRTARAERTRYRVRGRLEIQPGGEGQANLLIGREPAKGWISVAYRAGVGVTLLRYDAGSDTWSTLGFGASAEPELGQVHAFAVRVLDGTVTAFLDGRRVVEAAIEAHPLDGAWGLGVQSGGAVAWTGVELDPLR